MRYTLIAAADEAWGIGKDDALPWHCPQDLQRFRKRTIGGLLVMGRRTFDTLPKKLDRRTILVLGGSTKGEGRFATLDLLMAELDRHDPIEVLVAGGAAIYGLFTPLADRAEITRIPGIHDCDRHMPSLEHHGFHLAENIPNPDGTATEIWLRKL